MQLMPPPPMLMTLNLFPSLKVQQLSKQNHLPLMLNINKKRKMLLALPATTTNYPKKTFALVEPPGTRRLSLAFYWSPSLFSSSWTPSQPAMYDLVLIHSSNGSKPTQFQVSSSSWLSI